MRILQGLMPHRDPFICHKKLSSKWLMAGGGVLHNYWSSCLFKGRPKHSLQTVRMTSNHKRKGYDYQWSPPNSVHVKPLSKTGPRTSALHMRRSLYPLLMKHLGFQIFSPPFKVAKMLFLSPWPSF